MMHLGQIIQEAMDRKGLKRKAMAKLVGVTVSQISRWMAGESKPKLENADRLSKVLDLPSNWWQAGNESLSHEPEKKAKKRGNLVVLGRPDPDGTLKNCISMLEEISRRGRMNSLNAVEQLLRALSQPREGSVDQKKETA